MTKSELATIKGVINHLRMDRASFSSIVPSLDPPEMQLPMGEKFVDTFIKARVRLYMESWCIAPLQGILDKYAKKGMTI